MIKRIIHAKSTMIFFNNFTYFIGDTNCCDIFFKIFVVFLNINTKTGIYYQIEPK